MYLIRYKLNNKWVSTGERFTTRELAASRLANLSAKYKTITYSIAKAN